MSFQLNVASYHLAFNNTSTGTVNVQAGYLGLSSGGSDAGHIDMSASSSVRVTNYSFSVLAGATFTGAGTVIVNGGDLVIAGAVSIPRLSLGAGDISGAGDLTITGNMDWSGGAMYDTGLTIIGATATLSIAGGNGNLVLYRPVRNDGTTTWSSGTIEVHSETFTNNGTFIATTTGSLYYAGDGSNSTFSVFANNGTFTKQGAGSVSFQLNVASYHLAFNNTSTGTVNVQAGSLSFSAGSTSAGITHVDGGELDLPSSFSFGASATLITQPGSLVYIGGSLTGTTTNADLFSPQGTIQFANGNQSLEAMSRDVGSNPAGYIHNFAFGRLQLSGSSYLQIVDVSDNSPGVGSEAVYVNTLVVPAGSTLDLNGKHLYARATQIFGNVIGGAVSVLTNAGPLGFSSPTPGVMSIAGGVDEWTVSGRAGHTLRVAVDPGFTLPPPGTLGWAQVQGLDPQGVSIASASNSVTGQNSIVELLDVSLPADGTYRIRVSAPTGHTTSTGRYLIATYDTTIESNVLPLGQQRSGAIETPFARDQWNFSAFASQQVRFDLLATQNPQVVFTLSGPNGFVAFADSSTSPGLISLPFTGQYSLSVHGVSAAIGAYSLQMVLTSQTLLPIGQSVTGAQTQSGMAQLFRVDVPTTTALLLSLQDEASADRNEMYVRFGTPPTRTDYDYRYESAASADQSVLVPSARAGNWYILVYGQSIPAPSTFNLSAFASGVIVRTASPERSASGAATPISVVGAGFKSGLVIELVSAANAVVATATDVQIDGYTRASAILPLGSVVEGVYGLRVRMPDGSTNTLPGSFTVLPSGQAHLETRLIMPSDVGRHAFATFYVEYANTGTVAMQAPLIRLQSADPDGSDKPILTLDQTRVTGGLWTSGLPDGFRTSIQILGNGATPGLLNAGERITIPVYYVGLLQPWTSNDNQVEMELRVFDSANTDLIPWNELRDQLRPPSIQADAWNAIYGNLAANVGPTWGSFVQMLSDNAQFLSRLGEDVYDVGQLWSFEVQQAIGFNPVRTLASSLDADIAASGGDLTFGRSYSLSIDQRFSSSIFGRGWSVPWLTTLTVDSSGTVDIIGASGSRRRFQPDTRYTNAYFALPGDSGTLTRISAGVYELRETSGDLVRFNAAGQIDYTKDANGNRVTMGYLGTRLSTLTHSSGVSLALAYNGAGLVSSITDSVGRVTSYGYDASSQYLISETQPDGQVVSYTYDTTSNSPRQHALTSVTGGGVTQFYTYDTLGRLATTYTSGNAATVTFSYDTAGRVSATDAAGGTSSLYYDKLGLVKRAVDPFGNVTTSVYDDNNRLSRLVDPVGQSRTFTWCNCGSMTSVTDELGHTTRFSYANIGTTSDGAVIRRMTSFTDANGNITAYAYDTRGNLIATTYPNQSVERVGGYDLAGNPLSFINRRGQTLSYAYNSVGHVTRETFVDNTFNDFTYDAHGNLLTVTEPGNHVTTFAYDAADRLTQVTYPNGRYLAFTFDQYGRRASLTDQSGFVVNYSFDAAGRLAGLTDGSGTVIVQYAYDAAGRLSRKDNGNGTYTTYSYDLAGQVLSIVNNAPGGSANSRFVYTYDALGRRVTQTTLDGAWSYGYDATGQLTSAVFVPVQGSAVPAQNLQYTYDAMGNRTRTVENGVTTNYSANALNQYTQVGGDVLVCDADGNLVSRSGPSGNATYQYDQLNRLVRVVTPDGTWQYEYDAFGNRIASTLNGQRTEYLLDPTGLVDVVGEYASAGALVARYVHGQGLVTRQDGLSGSRAFYDFVGLGSTATITGTDGQIANRYVYSPFGSTILTSGSITNPFQFVGAFGVTSEGGSSVFMRARYSDTGQGRFIQADPKGLLGTQSNFYSYVENSPTTAIDVNGQTPLILAGAAIGAVASAIMYEIVWAGTGEGSLQGLAGATAGGALNGALTAAGGPVLGIVGGAAGGGVAYLGSVWGGNRYSAREFTASIGIGALLGLIPQTAGVFTRPKNWSNFGPEFPNTFNESNAHGKALWLNAMFTGAGSSAAAAAFPLMPWLNPGTRGGAGTSLSSARAIDPNRLLGPTGFGMGHYMLGESVFPYRIEFENYGSGSVNEDGSAASSDRWATAPAQRVAVMNTLSANVDLDSLLLTGFGFGDTRITITTPTQSFQQVLTMSYNGRSFNVEFEASLDYSTRTLRVTFQSLDPASGLPPDVLTGFLPPEDGSGRGKGYVSYIIRAAAGLATDTAIRNVALISFDNQTFIATNQVDPLHPELGTDPAKEALVTIDVTAPQSTVTSLPAVSPANIVVHWSDTDAGSGIATYTVFVNENGAGWQVWLQDTPLTQGTFAGTRGQSYAFYAVATDHVGLVEEQAASAEASTTVVGFQMAWDGEGGDNLWSNPLNWVGDTVPTAPCDVTLDGATNLNIIVDGPDVQISSVNNQEALTIRSAHFTVSGSMINAGTVTLSPGTTLQVGADFTQGADGVLVSQVGSDTSVGQLMAVGTAYLAGTAQVDFVNGYTPMIFTSYQFIQAAVVTGVFNATVSIPLDGGKNVLTYSGSGVSLLVTALGDFNSDGSVDFFDYLDFVDAFTQSTNTADFNVDGSIDFFDYLDFVDAFTRVW